MGNTSCGCECPPREIAYRNDFNNQNLHHGVHNKDEIKPIELSEIEAKRNKDEGQPKITSNLKSDIEKDCRESSTFVQGAGEFDASFLPLESEMKADKDKNANFQGDLTKIEETVLSSNKEDINVPYSVIKLIIPKEIKTQFKMIEENEEKENGSSISGAENSWKLEPEGYYTNRKQDGSLIMITNNSYYLGSTKPNSNLPDQKGVLITKEGNYQGNFANGKAQNRGRFTSIDEQSKFSGDWEKGRFIKGKAVGHNYIYDGSFEDSLPHGFGCLISYDQDKKEIFKYSGNFLNGKFDGMGRYECEKYIYSGKFKEGRKHGTGCLIMTEIQAGEREVQKLQGEWENDWLR